MKKILYLEGIRGYMALWVFFTHALTLATFPFHKEYGIGKILINGYWPVCMFIILSGFVTHILLEKEEPYKKFIFKRAFRLFPVYLFCLIITLLLMNFSKEVLTSIPWESDKNILRIEQIDLAFSKHFEINTISHFLLLHGLLPEKIVPASFTIMGQSWSLTLEWQFYLIVPLFYLALKNRFSKKVSLLIFITLIGSILFANYYMPQKTFLPNLLYLFGIGYFTYSFYNLETKHGKKNYTVLFLSIMVFFTLSLDLNLGLITILWLITLYYQIHPNRITNFIFANKIILFLGKISYSFYCVHMIILILVTYIILHIFGVESQNTFRFAVLGISLPLVLFVSYLTYTYIELPFMNYAKKK